ncbi:MAG: hypothetical protein QNJ51_28365 [Calothrix sp. MO_167.B12]|nr:hypothetical protein [Calothrix sp. MO_167.B12]
MALVMLMGHGIIQNEKSLILMVNFSFSDQTVIRIKLQTLFVEVETTFFLLLPLD